MIRSLVYIGRYDLIGSPVRRGVIRVFTGKLSVDLLGVCRRGRIMKRDSCFAVRLTVLPAMCCLAVALVSPKAGFSQANTATFHGTVTDASEAVLSAANVTLTNERTRAVLTQTSGNTGEFVFAFVPPGVYTLRIEVSGFKALTVAGITLSAGQQARVNYAMELGAVTETVKVEGTASLVNTVSSEQLKTFQPGEVRELPLQNRNFTRILILTPGAV